MMGYKKSFMKLTKGIISCVLALSIVALLNTQAFAYPLSYAIDVNGVAQQKSNWCWAATGECILDYFGKPVSQTDFAIFVKGKNPPPNELAFDSDVKRGLEQWGVSGTLTSSYLSFSTIITEIYNNERPIYSGWTWSSGGGHAVVIDGYNDNNGTQYVDYMNPNDGAFHQSTYSWFKGGSSYDHVWDGTIYQMANN